MMPRFAVAILGGRLLRTALTRRAGQHRDAGAAPQVCWKSCLVQAENDATFRWWSSRFTLLSTTKRRYRCGSLSFSRGLTWRRRPRGLFRLEIGYTCGRPLLFQDAPTSCRFMQCRSRPFNARSVGSGAWPKIQSVAMRYTFGYAVWTMTSCRQGTNMPVHRHRRIGLWFG